jgi:hypothetical protein
MFRDQACNCAYHLACSNFGGGRVMGRPGIWVREFRKNLRAGVHSENKSLVMQAFSALQDFGTYLRV